MHTAVCLWVLDEERDLAEWLAYQIAVGFDTCLVYDNGSADRTVEIVRAFARHFDVRLSDWPDTDRRAQANCYNNCLSRFGREFDWSVKSRPIPTPFSRPIATP